MAAGDPTGADLCSGTTNGDTLPDVWPPTEPEEREITFGSSIELTSGVKYAIAVKAPDAADADDSALWMMKSSGAYANGAHYYSTDESTSWAVNGSADLAFTTLAEAVEKDTYSFAYEGGGAWVYGSAYWSAQTFTASSTYTITGVKLYLYRIDGSTPGTITVSIKATVGAPEKATTPAPANAATDVTLDQATLTWVDGGGADTYDVYYGTTSGALGDAVSSAQAGTSFTVTGITDGSPYGYLITRYWRIDSTNASGTTTGDEWSFTTIRFSAPAQTYWHSAEGYYYRLLIDTDGAYGTHPADGGVEDTDYEVLAGYLPNFVSTTRKLVGIANSKVWMEDI